MLEKLLEKFGYVNRKKFIDASTKLHVAYAKQIEKWAVDDFFGATANHSDKEAAMWWVESIEKVLNLSIDKPFVFIENKDV